MIYLIYILIYQILYSVLLAGIYIFITYVFFKLESREMRWLKSFALYVSLLSIVNLHRYVFPPFMYVLGEFSRVIILLILSYVMGRFIKDTSGKHLGYESALYITFIVYAIGYILSQLFGFGILPRGLH